MTPLAWAGAFDLAFAAFHLTFWRLLGWPRSLDPAGRVNAAVAQTLNIMLTFVLLASGLALVVGPMIGRTVDAVVPAIGAGFWLLRTALQPLLFPRLAPWSLALGAVFLAGFLLHAWAALA